MRIEVWHVGKTKSKWIAEGEQHYLKKCKRFAKIDVQYTSPSKANDSNQIRSDDGNTLLEKLNNAKPVYTFLLDERGKNLNSRQFAATIDKVTSQYGPYIRLITGGSHGVSEALRTQCDQVIAMSSMVFTHEMIRVILWEQVYRAFTILRGESYHHD